ncbi:MlaD family protein [Halobacteriovorax sp. GB3]|uniref:MlaD family protein n=1 Tax=Halobacteriovorax sp. GB3 TaxID=2719615 RepID=UPI0023629134|nr:MlaD family protein [Halobacteriovorax sp. GB3]MDD0853949.1 MlaD family protein [Halobacteriovorax sp. GB3]
MNEFKVGLMALVTMAAVIVLSLKVTSNQSGFGDYVTYKTIVRDASGIFPKTPIKVAGINAGRIKSIELKGNNAHIAFEVLKDVRIVKDSRLRIKSVGFLGDKYLELFIGESNQMLTEDSFIKADEGGGVDALVREANEIMKDVKIIVSSLKDSVAPAGEKPPIKVILEDVKALAANTKEVTASLKRIMNGNEEKINTMIANLEDFSEQIAFQTDNNEPESAMADVKKILANAERLTSDLKEMVADIKGGRGTLGKILVEEEIADEVKETLAGVKKMVNRVDAIRTEVSVFTGANTDFGADSYAHLKIYPSPERFYLIGVSTSEFGPESETQTTRIINGTETNEIERERVKDKLRFDVQLGRQIHDWTLRGGFIESTAGLGVDYHLYSLGSKVSAELFDYRDDIGFNLRLSTEIQIWNVLYGRVAGEDILDDNRSATFAAGLRFNDEDLKGLLGFFL